MEQSSEAQNKSYFIEKKICFLRFCIYNTKIFVRSSKINALKREKQLRNIFQNIFLGYKLL